MYMFVVRPDVAAVVVVVAVVFVCCCCSCCCIKTFGEWQLKPNSARKNTV